MPTVEDERAVVENLVAVFGTDDDWGYFLTEVHSWRTSSEEQDRIGRGPGTAEIGSLAVLRD